MFHFCAIRLPLVWKRTAHSPPLGGPTGVHWVSATSRSARRMSAKRPRLFQCPPAKPAVPAAGSAGEILATMPVDPMLVQVMPPVVVSTFQPTPPTFALVLGGKPRPGARCTTVPNASSNLPYTFGFATVTLADRSTQLCASTFCYIGFTELGPAEARLAVPGTVAQLAIEPRISIVGPRAEWSATDAPLQPSDTKLSGMLPRDGWTDTSISTAGLIANVDALFEGPGFLSCVETARHRMTKPDGDTACIQKSGRAVSVQRQRVASAEYAIVNSRFVVAVNMESLEWSPVFEPVEFGTLLAKMRLSSRTTGATRQVHAWRSTLVAALGSDLSSLEHVPMLWLIECVAGPAGPELWMKGCVAGLAKPELTDSARSFVVHPALAPVLACPVYDPTLATPAPTPGSKSHPKSLASLHAVLDSGGYLPLDMVQLSSATEVVVSVHALQQVFSRTARGLLRNAPPSDATDQAGSDMRQMCSAMLGSDSAMILSAMSLTWQLTDALVQASTTQLVEQLDDVANALYTHLEDGVDLPCAQAADAHPHDVVRLAICWVEFLQALPRGGDVNVARVRQLGPRMRRCARRSATPDDPELAAELAGLW